MKKKLFIFVLLTVMLVMVAGCAPGTVVQVNTPVPNTQAGTPTPSGQINVPGVSIQIYAPGPNPTGQYSRCAWSGRRYLDGNLARDHLPGDSRDVIC